MFPIILRTVNFTFNFIFLNLFFQVSVLPSSEPRIDSANCIGSGIIKRERVSLVRKHERKDLVGLWTIQNTIYAKISLRQSRMGPSNLLRRRCLLWLLGTLHVRLSMTLAAKHASSRKAPGQLNASLHCWDLFQTGCVDLGTIIVLQFPPSESRRTC